MILYTGDEMGYIHKWDLSRLIKKLEDFDQKVEESKGQHRAELLNEFLGGLKQFEKVAYNEDLKIEEEKKEPLRATFKEVDDSNTFMTEAMNKDSKDPTVKDESLKIDPDKNVVILNRWKAHTDGITWITFNDDP